MRISFSNAISFPTSAPVAAEAILVGVWVEYGAIGAAANDSNVTLGFVEFYMGVRAELGNDTRKSGRIEKFTLAADLRRSKALVDDI